MIDISYRIVIDERYEAELRELFAEVWPIAEYAGYEHELSRARELMRELGMEVES